MRVIHSQNQGTSVLAKTFPRCTPPQNLTHRRIRPDERRKKLYLNGAIGPINCFRRADMKWNSKSA